jgi:L-seryl-tRNA(Ser) seleniumtransferase
MTDPRSRIPSVDRLVADAAFSELVDEFGRYRVVDAVRRVVEVARDQISSAAEEGRLDEWEEKVARAETYAGPARTSLEASDVASLRGVINATGVVLHTNLGRAPLADVAVRAMTDAAAEYTNLEYDLDSGERGSRYSHCVSLLVDLTGAEDALVVNNAAGALVLALNTSALGEGVAVSRGELVEIGGGFRIPEVLERAGARLVEVGSTNRTRKADYAASMGAEVSALLKVHRSNFRITGFTEDTTVHELGELAAEAGIPLIHDLGSGLLVSPELVGLPAEPRAAESLAEGADVVVVSGDKLLGGPQAGILVGRADLMQRMRKNPLCRALRVDKVTLAGLEATLRLYRDESQALREVPTLRMLAADPADLRAQAEDLRTRLAAAGVDATVAETLGAVGGGTFPGVELSSWALCLRAETGVDGLARSLREGAPPVIGRIVDDALYLDVRTILPGQEDDLVRRVSEASSEASAVQ